MALAAYGFAVASLPLDFEDHFETPRGTIECSARNGTLPRRGPRWFDTSTNSLTLGWAGYGEFTVTVAGGARIDARLGPITMLEGAFCVLCSVLPAALPLFDLEPLHGAAVRLGIDGPVLALLGASGRGKSTLVAALVADGLPLVTDDACAIDPSGSLWPGPGLVGLRDLRTWDRTTADEVGSYDGKTMIRANARAAGPLPVGGTLLLDPGPEAKLAVAHVEGPNAVAGILGQVRAPHLFAKRRRPAQLAALAHVTSRPVARVTYAPGRHSPSEVAARILDWAHGKGLSA